MPVLQCFAPGKKEGNKFIESDLRKQPEKDKSKEGDKEKEKIAADKKKVEENSKVVDDINLGSQSPTIGSVRVQLVAFSTFLQ